MATYLAPGVYVEEVSFSAPTIEGVGTTTTAFVGPTLTGPIGGVPYGGMPNTNSPIAGAPSGGVPPMLTSFGDFQNIYGGYGNLAMTLSQGSATATPPILPTPSPAGNVNYMAMAVKAFFDNGGSMMYVSRVFANLPYTGPAVTAGAPVPTIDPGIASSATAAPVLPGATAPTTAPDQLVVAAARFPGALLTGQSATISLSVTKLQLSATNTRSLQNLPPGSLLGVPGSKTFYTNGTSGTFMSSDAPPVALLSVNPLPSAVYALTLQVAAPGPAGQTMVYSNLGLDPASPNYIGNALGVNPPRPIDALQNQVWIKIDPTLATPVLLMGHLFPGWATATAPVGTAIPVPTLNPMSYPMWGGNDGGEPIAQSYVNALTFIQALEDVAIVGAPGSGIYGESTDIIVTALIPHVEAPRAYRVAILESPPNQIDSQYQDLRSHMDSTYSALYVPWVMASNPLAAPGTAAAAQISVPPTGYMAGIYARNDEQNSVAKAPANEVVLGAMDFERHINFAEQQLLNPLGINCLRFFPDRGYRVWGARTATSNTELMYVNVRRYLVYLEHSIDAGTQWAVFENNGPSLWARVTDSIDSFLDNEYASGNLLGTSAASAYFVRCDRTTMTQNDLDNGRMICVIGVALLKPAEFVIFRIGQMTASASS